LWELITGVRLFGGDNDHAVLLKVLEKPVDAPSRIVGELPEELDAITLRGLARDPSERFGSAREMILALEGALPAASAGEIGKFVDELCRADLDLLDQRAASAEAAGEESIEARTPRKRSWIAGAALLVLMGALGATLLALRSRAAPELEPARPQEQPQPAPVMPPVLVPSTTAAPMAAPSAEPNPAPTRRPTAQPPRSTGSARPAPKPDCDPPYTIDSEGYHRMKPECL
jgi:serine/threonine-protein kinase